MGYLESYRTPGQRRFSVEQMEQFLETLQQRRAGQSPHPGTPSQLTVLTAHRPPAGLRRRVECCCVGANNIKPANRASVSLRALP